MPTYKDETQEYHKERIREVLTLKPYAGSRTIREVLENDSAAPLVLHRVYINKLRRKIETERAHRFDRIKVDKRLAEIQDRTESIITQMWRILLDVKIDERARVQAAKVIVDADHKLFDAQLNAGIFERKLGTVDVKHVHELASDQQLLILRALQNYGIIRDTTKSEPAQFLEPRASEVVN